MISCCLERFLGRNSTTDPHLLATILTLLLGKSSLDHCLGHRLGRISPHYFDGFLGARVRVDRRSWHDCEPTLVPPGKKLGSYMVKATLSRNEKLVVIVEWKLFMANLCWWSRYEVELRKSKMLSTVEV